MATEAVVNEMIERVARALAAERDALSEIPWRDIPSEAEHDFLLARAAIEAMREPTVEMRDVGENARPGRVWDAMIAAALAD